MPTYVAQPQASRAGLITTIVILCILTILMTSLFFVRDSEAKKTQVEYDAFRVKYADAIAPDKLTSEDYTAAKTAAKTLKKSVFDFQVQQQNDMSTVITGSPLAPADAVARGDYARTQNNEALKKYGDTAGVKVADAGNLVEAVGRWTAIADRLIAERDKFAAQAQSNQKGRDEAERAAQAAQKELNDKIAAAQKETTDVRTQLEALQKTQADNLTAVKTGADQSTAALQQQMQAVQQQIAQATTALADVTKRRDYLLQVLRRFKANNNPKEDILNVPDGVITAVSGNECFINLGEGDQISRGMTFEVYDPNKGIPHLGEGTSTPDRLVRTGAGGAAAAAARGPVDKYQFDLPKGKGSIEVIAVGPGHQSTCRVIHTEEGMTVGQGDLIANLVYDKNIKSNFVVFGEFDFANGNANARANDAPVVARLIQQWGGNVQPIADPAKPADSVTAETDFVVVGREPVIPNFTAEEAQQPGNAEILDRAKARMAAYQSVLSRAGELGIPVMNQNRFLYYVGYYDQARR